MTKIFDAVPSSSNLGKVGYYERSRCFSFNATKRIFQVIQCKYTIDLTIGSMASCSKWPRQDGIKRDAQNEYYKANCFSLN